MPDIFHNTVQSIIEPARLTEVSVTTTKTFSVAPDGIRSSEPIASAEQTFEKWVVRALVDVAWVGEQELIFEFPSKAEAEEIVPGHRYAA